MVTTPTKQGLHPLGNQPWRRLWYPWCPLLHLPDPMGRCSSHRHTRKPSTTHFPKIRPPTLKARLLKLHLIYILCMCVEGARVLGHVCGGQSSTCKHWSFPSPCGTGVAHDKHLYVQLDFEGCPHSPSHPLSSTPACHGAQNLSWTQQHTRVDRHFESPGLLAFRDAGPPGNISPSVPSLLQFLPPLAKHGKEEFSGQILLPLLALSMTPATASQCTR